MSSSDLRVVIVGAGVGGLTLALLLRRRGIAAEVVEQAPELREAGAAIALASNATRVLEHLGLGDELARLAGHEVEPDYQAWLDRVLPQVAFMVWPGSGHFPHLAHPRRFAECLAATARWGDLR
jgi:2-polyprenyl-6-methoxyphenol hydroxylase-like FAD-dependent oxidoreductase